MPNNSAPERRGRAEYPLRLPEGRKGGEGDQLSPPTVLSTPDTEGGGTLLASLAVSDSLWLGACGDSERGGLPPSERVGEYLP